MEPVVLGVILKLETQGWSGAPPLLPKEPVKSDETKDGRRTFFYDLSPKDQDLSVTDACLRIYSRLERMLSSPAALPKGEYASRLTLELGVLADRDREAFGYAWPLEFLATLVDLNIELAVTHYLPKPDEENGKVTSADFWD